MIRNSELTSPVILRFEACGAKHRVRSLEGCTATMQPGRRPSRLGDTYDKSEFR